MPGCACEKEQQNRDIYLSSYGDLVEQIKTTISTVSDHEIRVQAAQIFRPRYRLDKASEAREAASLPEYEIGHFTITDSEDIKYLEYERTLEEMQQSLIRQRPAEYSPEEHQTSRMIKEAFKNGATVVSTVYARKDDDHRDILVMKYDPVTRIGTTSIINTATTGKDYTFESAHAIARHRFSSLIESKPAERVFILSDATVARQREKEIVREVQQAAEEASDMKPTEQRGYWRREAVSVSESKASDRNADCLIAEYHNMQRDVPRQNIIIKIVEEGEQIGKRFMRDVITTHSRVIEEIKKNKTEKEEKTNETRLVAARIIDNARTRLILNDKKEVLSSATEKAQKQSAEFPNPGKREILDEKPEGFMETLQEARKIMDGAQKMVTLALDSQTEPVAAPAVIYALDILAYPEKILVEDGHEIKEEDPVLFLTEEEREAVVDFLTSNNKKTFPVESTQKTETALNIEHIDMTILAWVKELIQCIDHEPVEQAIETIKHKEEVTFFQMSQLWEILVGHNSRIHSASFMEGALVRKGMADLGEISHPEERELVQQCSLAVTAWLLLKLTAYHCSVHAIKTFICEKENNKYFNLSNALREKLPEGLAEKELGQWILFAIIWYLVMIREQGMRQVHGSQLKVQRKKKTKNLKKLRAQKSLMMPAQGLIFVFGS